MKYSLSVLRLFTLFAFLSTGAHAQWLNFATPGIPRTPDGKPNLSAPAPRTADGKPDLSGAWMHEPNVSPAEAKRLLGRATGDPKASSDGIDSVVALQVPGQDFSLYHKYGTDVLIDFTPDESPLRPEAAEVMRQRAASRNPGNPCPALPRYTFPHPGLFGGAIKVIQSPRVTVVLYEIDNLHRQIFTDGRTVPKEFDFPSFLGYSAGHWERDVLVVETAGFNDKTALDSMGHPHSEALHVTERFRRPNFGHLEVEMTFDDPKMYTRPFTIKISYNLLADADIFESFCNENEKDGVRMPKR
jgi:hypothetical protein